MPKSTTLALAALALTMGAAPLAAQDSAAEAEFELDPTLEGGQDIVVTGEREELEAQARDQALTITPRDLSHAAPLARMTRPVCPGIYGATEETAYEIIGRLRSNADRIGHSAVRGRACSPNVIVAFVDDPLAEFNDLRDNHHELVDGLDYWAAKRVREQDGDVLAWNVTIMKNRDGIGSDGRPPVFETTSSGRLELGVREDIEASVVMIRRDAIEGLDTIAIADYVTMRALARTEPTEGTTQLGTILELFDESVEAPPYRLTAFDEAYLTSLYRQDANTPSRLALRDVGALMVRRGE